MGYVLLPCRFSSQTYKEEYKVSSRHDDNMLERGGGRLPADYLSGAW